MVHLLIDRKWRKPEYTIGRLYVNGEFLCNTIEDKDRGLYQGMSVSDLVEKKVPSETAIPTGTYKLQISYSPKFKRDLIEVMNVGGFQGIRFHRGNTAADSAGCIIVGINNAQGRVSDSTKYEQIVTDIVRKADEAYLTII